MADGLEKVCNECLLIKPLTAFKKIKERKSGYGAVCKICISNKQKVSRERCDDKYTKKYEKTKKGFLVRLYRNMKSRIEGIQKTKFHLYQGKELLSKEAFYAWALSNQTFHSLFTEYEESNYQRRLAPSVDRINSDEGYSLSNMEFIPMWMNSQRGALSKRRYGE